MTDETNATLVELATELTIAWLGNPNSRFAPDEVPVFLRAMYETVSDLAGGSGQPPRENSADSAAVKYVPAVTVRKSLASKEHIISMIDGKPYKILRRHLSIQGLSPDEYRRRYNLKPDYPMVAQNYSEARRAMAKKIDLGNKARREGSAQA